MKSIFYFFVISILTTSSLFAQNEDVEYLKVLNQRSEKIANTLDIKDAEAYKRVVATIVDQYKNVGVINDNLDAAKKEVKQNVKDKAELDKTIINLENEAKAKIYDQQCAFIGGLAVDLTNDQIEKVKDGLTYGVVKVTYDSYCDMVPSLKDYEKRQIYAWLVEAREHAISASSSKDKHGWFGKYKGRVNNYLSKQGYDIQAERKAWEERVKARGGTL